MRTLLITLLCLFAMNANASWSSHSRDIVMVADQVDVNATTLATLVHLESRFNSKATNRYSNAGGLTQFTNSTWRAMIKRYGHLYGYNHRTSKYNARANLLMAAHYMKEHQAALRKVLKREPIPGEIYMAHLLGLGGAIKLFKASSGRSAASVLPSAAAGNKRLFYTDKGKARTARQFRDYNNWVFASIGKNYTQDVEFLTARI